MSTLLELKARSAYREAQEKSLEDRKRNILVLIIDYLNKNGYLEAAQKLIIESSLNNKFETADNMDLNTIITQFEDYYEFKYLNKPKFIRSNNTKINEKSDRIRNNPPTSAELSSLAMKKANHFINPTVNRRSDNNIKIDTSTSKDNKEVKDNKEAKDHKSEDIITPITSSISKPSVLNDLNVSVSGTAIKPQQQIDHNNQPLAKMLKPSPYLDNEFRDLAATISRDIFLETPNVHWEDIAELYETKQLLLEAVVYPLKYPQLFSGILSPWRGILLYGPPGTGKTMLAKAVATECKTTFFNISASSIVSKWRGDSEKLVRVLFELARYHAPSTIFIDEIDSIMSSRDGAGANDHEGSKRMKTELLIQMDGLNKTDDLVFVLAASNLPWDLDAAMLRRLEKRILVPLPTQVGRKIIVEKLLPITLSEDLDYQTIALQTVNFSGSDITLLCKEAAMRPVRKILRKLALGSEDQLASELSDPPKVSMFDVSQALLSVKPSCSKKTTEKYENYHKQFGAGASLTEEEEL